MKKVLLGLGFVLGLLWGGVSESFAQVTSAAAAPLETVAEQAIVVEDATGDVLYAKMPDQQMPTSSMSKVMTMYVVFEAIKNGKISMDTKARISEHAWAQTGSRMFAHVGDDVVVEDLTRGVIIQSGNDAAVALAELVGGSEEGFVQIMNQKAEQMGLKNTHFMNATGLPDPQHYSTPADLAKLARALIHDFPEHYHFYSEKEFTYNKIKQGNRNPLLYRNIGVDGMKTGHTEAAGYGLIASALREGRRIIAVLNGMASMQERADESAKLIEWAYREYGLFDVFKKDQKVGDVRIWLGQKMSVPVGAAQDVRASLPRALKDSLKIELSLPAEVEAPVKKGQVLGTATVTGKDFKEIDVKLVALEDGPRLSPIRVLWAKFKRFVGMK